MANLTVGKAPQAGFELTVRKHPLYICVAGPLKGPPIILKPALSSSGGKKINNRLRFLKTCLIIPARP
jgi:hypothetical protein